MKEPSGLTSASLSLLELRRHLLRQAGTLAVRARRLRSNGDRLGAADVAAQSQRLRTTAKSMGKGTDAT